MDADGNSYGPYDNEVPGSEGEPFTEAAWDALYGHVSGVASGGALTFSGLTAQLAAIKVIAHGFWLRRTAAWSQTSLPESGTLPRRDLLVARRQMTIGSGVGATPGKTVLTILQGIPASSPANPAHDPANDELLWSWRVPAGGGTVVTDIRDHRRPLPGAAVGGDWENTTYASGYAAAAGYQRIQEYTASADRVELRGVIDRVSGDITNGAHVASLAVAARFPKTPKRFTCATSGDAIVNVTVNTDGRIVTQYWQGSDMGNAPALVFLDGIFYDPRS